MKHLRILMVLDFFHIGGTETHVLSLTRELTKQGIFVAVVGGNGLLSDQFHAIGCPIYTIDFPVTLKHDFNIEQKLDEIIKHEKITLVHAHQTPSGFLSLHVAKRLGIPTVFTVHGSYYPEAELKKLLKQSDSIIAVSPPLVHKLQDYEHANVSLIANGINRKEFSKKNSEHLRNSIGITKQNRTIVYASRITWEKATKCMMLMKACKDLKLKYFSDLHLIIVGGGNRLPEIKKIAIHLNRICKDEFIHVVGEQEDMSLYYSLGDIVVGTGRIALEAMACEKPVIAVGNHGYFGLVNDTNFIEAWNHYYGDHDSHTNCSRFILAKDIKAFFNLPNKIDGSKLRNLVMKQFNIEQKVKELMDVYNNLNGRIA